MSIWPCHRKLAYQYFLWRRSTWNDLQLILGINLVLLAIAALFKTAVVDPWDGLLQNEAAPPLGPVSWLQNLYQVSALRGHACGYNPLPLEVWFHR